MSSKPLKWLVPLILVLATLDVFGSTCEFPITTSDRQVFNVTVTYELEKAYAGNQYFPLELSITSNNGRAADLVLRECRPPDGARLETNLESAGEARYRCVVNVKNEADPRRYRIDFIFQYNNKESIPNYCLLAVGVRTNRDAGGNDRVSIKPKASPIEFQAAGRNEFPFDIHNSFPDYPAVIKSVTLTASRPDLLTNIDLSSLEGQSNIDPLQTTHANAKFDVAGMTLRDLLIGFPDKAHINVDVTYTDGFGRTISDLHQEFPITLRPRDRVLYLAIVIGVIVGALIKIYLQRLQSQGVINSREVVKAMAITILVGLVVSIIALAGQIKITAFELTGSYDKPIVIFIIGVTGALIGAQLLMSWMKRLGGRGETNDS